MLRSLTSAVTGLKNFTIQLDVLGNNLANIRTLGFKGSRVTFAESLALTIKGQQQVGLGVNLSAADTDFTQGSLEFTGTTTDLAVQGNSFFVLNDGERDRYTRVGNFFFNADGELLNPNGMIVQGWVADENGEIDSTLPTRDVKVNMGAPSVAQVSQNVFLSGNLDSTLVPKAQELKTSLALRVGDDLATGTTNLNDVTTATLVSGTDTITISGTKADGTAVSGTFTYGVTGTTINQLVTYINTLYAGSSTASFDAEEGKIVLRDNVQEGDLVMTGGLPDETETSITLGGTIDLPPFETAVEGFAGTVSTSTLVYDSIGEAHNLIVTFTNKGSGEWTWKASIVSEDPTDQTALDPSADEGIVEFGDNGQVVVFRGEGGASPDVTIIPDPRSRASRFTVQLNAGGSESYSGITQFSADPTLTVREQDGRPLGTLLRYSIDENGIITGQYSNDETAVWAQIALAEFPNPYGLVRGGNGIFDLGAGTGIPIVGTAGERFNSAIISGALEASNVDLVRQFTDMITAQRGFQASARVVTTADQVLDETLRLKR